MAEETITPEKERPAFLTTLCVLTFAFLPLFMTINIEGWLFMKKTSAAMESAMEMAGSMGMPDEQGTNSMIEQAEAGIRTANITFFCNLGGALLCFLGAMQMWKLKKMGYFFYLTGSLLPLFISAFNLTNASLGDTVYYIIPLMSVSTLTFVVLYGLNYKHMK